MQISYPNPDKKQTHPGTKKIRKKNWKTVKKGKNKRKPKNKEC